MEPDEDKVRLAAETLGEMPILGRHLIGDVTLVRLKHVLAEYQSDGAGPVDEMLATMVRIVLETYRGTPPAMPSTEEALGIAREGPSGTVG